MVVQMLKPQTVILDGLGFPEAPRWHNGALWFSDMTDGRVYRMTASGRARPMVQVAGQPSGLGWLPDGRLLVVSMQDRALWRLDPDGLVQLADLSMLADFHCNDMVVDRHGRAYVGNFGFDLPAKAAPQSTHLILVTPEGHARIVADDLMFPNGAVITPDGRTLIVAETFASRLTAFTIEENGDLSDRREWAVLERFTPDGICLDSEGAVWAASPIGAEVLRIVEGGQVTHRIGVERPHAIACALGGADGCTLFIASGRISFNTERSREQRSGCIETVRVPFAGASAA